MADNVSITPGSGATVATDDVGGAQYQRVKLDVGGDGLSVPVVGTVPISGSVTAAISNYPATQNVNPTGETAGVGVGAAADTSASNSVIGRLKAILAVLPAALGQGTMAQSSPVVIASNQSAVSVNPTGETAGVGVGAAADTSASNSVIGRLKALIALLPTALGQSTMANSLRVVIASDQTVVPVSDNAGSLTVDAPVATPVFVELSDGAAIWKGSKVSASSLPVVIASDQAAVPVTVPTLTKGTQNAQGLSVQDLKDSGRVNILWTAEFAHAQTAETLLTMTESRDGAATTTFTSKVVTSGKRLRITSMFLETELLGTGTTPIRSYLRMKFNTAGAVTTASPLQVVLAVGVETAILKASKGQSLEFPDGIEFLGDGTKQIGFTLETPDWVTTTATGRSKITVYGYEY